MALLCAIWDTRVLAGVTTDYAPVRVAASALMDDKKCLQSIFAVRKQL